jgi:hypothetical protein
LLLQGQVIAFQHGGRRRQLLAAQRVGGDDLGLQFQGAARELISRAAASGVKRQRGRDIDILGKTAKRIERKRYNITSLFRCKRNFT